MYLKSLISAVALCACASAAADWTHTEVGNVDVDFSGFVYGTWFEDGDWNRGKTAVAVNLDVTTNNFRFNTQVGTDENGGDHPLRRIFLEYSYPKRGTDSDTDNVHSVTVGRFTRLDSFYNNATDNPGSVGMAVLPFAGYNYRYQDGTFTSIDGIQYRLQHKTDGDDLITAKASWGRMYIDDEEKINRHLNGGKSVSRGIEYTGGDGTWDAAVHYETDHWHVFYARTVYKMDVVAKPTATFMERIRVNIAKEFDYTNDRLGIRYRCNTYFVQGEFLQGITRTYSNTNVETTRLTARDGYMLAGLYINDYVTVYAGHSRGRSVQEVKYVKPSYSFVNRADDSWVGISYEYGKYAAALDWHTGEGQSWAKIGSDTEEWKSLIASFTYRF